MSLKQGTLVKYNSAAVLTACAWAPVLVPVPAACPVASHCYWDLSWSWDEVANLIGIVLETEENNRVKVSWFGINKTFIEYERYLEKIK